ncbi:hypothetical protein SprV_0100120500 [Sparganum proliferum]
MGHKRAIRGGDSLSQVTIHAVEEGHECKFWGTGIMARASNKTRRKLLEGWVSDINSINRHVDMLTCDHALRSCGQEARPNSQIRAHSVTTLGAKFYQRLGFRERRPNSGLFVVVVGVPIASDTYLFS